MRVCGQHRQESLSPQLSVITALVLGGASLNGGCGTISGTILGLLIIGVLNTGQFNNSHLSFHYYLTKEYNNGKNVFYVRTRKNRMTLGPDPLFSVDGKVAIISGAGSGFGRTIALALAERGASVGVLDITEKAAEETTELITSSGGRAITLVADTRDAEIVEKCVQEVMAKFGIPQIVIASAGIGRRSPAIEMTSQTWQDVIDVNLNGAWNLAQATGRAMITTNTQGSIIFISSIAGLVGLPNGNANYSASKGAVHALMRTLAIEWATQGVRVNAIAPTHFRTPLIVASIKENPEGEAFFKANIPMGRMGEPEEIVGSIIYLASEASSMVTGTVLVVDGGHTAR